MLNIITACSRPENLELLKKSISDATHIGPYKWTIIYDLQEKTKKFTDSWIIEIMYYTGGISGNPQKNLGIDLTDNGDLIFVLDDDNLLHPNLYKAVQALERYTNYPACVHYQQLMDDTINRVWIRKVTPDTIKECFIDQAQIIFRKSCLNGLRMKESEYTADGIFIEALYNQCNHKFLIIPEVLCYYNRLRWPEKWTYLY